MIVAKTHVRVYLFSELTGCFSVLLSPWLSVDKGSAPAWWLSCREGSLELVSGSCDIEQKLSNLSILFLQLEKITVIKMERRVLNLLFTSQEGGVSVTVGKFSSYRFQFPSQWIPQCFWAKGIRCAFISWFVNTLWLMYRKDFEFFRTLWLNIKTTF